MKTGNESEQVFNKKYSETSGQTENKACCRSDDFSKPNTKNFPESKRKPSLKELFASMGCCYNFTIH
jgi:hypothetical protein